MAIQCLSDQVIFFLTENGRYTSIEVSAFFLAIPACVFLRFTGNEESFATCIREMTGLIYILGLSNWKVSVKGLKINNCTFFENATLTFHE